MLKRYLVFGHATYYPEGGWSDFKGSFDSLEEADALAEQLDNDPYVGNSHVVDTHTGDFAEDV